MTQVKFEDDFGSDEHKSSSKIVILSRILLLLLLAGCLLIGILVWQGVISPDESSGKSRQMYRPPVAMSGNS